MRAVIIDNEPPMIRTLSGLLEMYCPDVTLVGTADGVATGEKLILEVNPDVIFLDVEMGDGTGLDLVERLNFRKLHVIFVTAHDKYAINAFRYSAIDFLLKPVDPEDLMNALKKFQQAKNPSPPSENGNLVSDYFYYDFSICVMA